MRRSKERNDTVESAGTVAIVGRPNVGKSALFNRLAGRNIAIVHDQPGITRDRLAARCLRGKRPFTVWDTGGIGGVGEAELTSQVRNAADAAIRDSDLILFVVDAQEGLTPVDQELARFLRKSKVPVVLVVNKIDHPKHDDLEADFGRLGLSSSVPVSAAHGRGFTTLLEIIDSFLPDSSSVHLGPEHLGGEAKHKSSMIERPLALAIVGKPNAGKSSLINSILNDTRTIVSELPGTTRDAIDILYQRNGQSFLLIDTAGIRARSKHASSVEVFSVMRAERAIRRADLCLLVLDLTSGVTSQDKAIAGLIQKAEKPCLIVLNKWDLVKPKHSAKKVRDQIISSTREGLFFLQYAPLLIASALTGENVDRLFRLIGQIRRAAKIRPGTGPLNRLLRAAFTQSPPPMVQNRRLKLFYATQGGTGQEQQLKALEFVLFVNDPKLLSETYARYLEGCIRTAEPYPGLPIRLSCRARRDNV
jgi:GTP-binding protein